jgi:hydroxymethylpyrimidine pyrophosphatase-like HAD family hydrolase
MIITDLDRSLLKNDKTISEYTKNIFEKCRKNGFIVIFATARPIRSVINYIDTIKPNGVIYHNGAIVTAGGKLISQYGITPLKIKAVLKIIEKEYPEATVSVEMNDIMYTNFILPDDSVYRKIDFNELPEFNADKIIIGTISLKKINKLKKYVQKDLYLEIND